MTDLKRLLNPPEDFSAYPQHREFHADELNRYAFSSSSLIQFVLKSDLSTVRMSHHSFKSRHGTAF